MKRFLEELAAAKVDEESITGFLAMAAEFSISTKSGPQSEDFKEARNTLTATVEYFIEMAADVGATGGANEPPPAASPPARSATDKPTALKTPAAGAKRLSDATGGGGAAPKKAHVSKHVSASAESAVLNVSIDPAGVRSVPAFLVGKSLHVQLYTPELIKTFRAVRAANDAVDALGRELLEFEPDRNFLSLTEEEAADAPPTALAASMDTTCGSRLFHKLEQCRSAAVALRDVTNRTQKVFWLMDHTQGCGPLTYQQLLFREHHDVGAALSDPNFVPLETWEDQVKAAIVGCRQEKIGLTKDGKSLVGPIDPLVAQQLLRQGHVGATTPSGGGVRSHGSGGGGGGGATAPPVPPMGRAGATTIAAPVASTAPEGPTPREAGAPAKVRRRTPPGRTRPVRVLPLPRPREKESREPGDGQARPLAVPRPRHARSGPP